MQRLTWRLCVPFKAFGVIARLLLGGHFGAIAAQLHGFFDRSPASGDSDE